MEKTEEELQYALECIKATLDYYADETPTLERLIECRERCLNGVTAALSPNPTTPPTE